MLGIWGKSRYCLHEIYLGALELKYKEFIQIPVMPNHVVQNKMFFIYQNKGFLCICMEKPCFFTDNECIEVLLPLSVKLKMKQTSTHTSQLCPVKLTVTDVRPRRNRARHFQLVSTAMHA